MDALVMEGDAQLHPHEDFCESILSRFSNSTQEDHQHICTVIAAMSQGLQEVNDKKLPLTPGAYLNAACATLDGLLSGPEPSSLTVGSLLAILSLLFPRVSAAELKRNGAASSLVLRVLRSNSAAAEAGVAVYGLNCLAQLLTVGDSADWEEASQSFNVLLRFMTDSRRKVRRQAHLCIRDVLQKYQGKKALAPASECILNMFQKLLLLATESKPGSAEGPKGAQEVLHVLDAFKEFLSLMSTKSVTIILNRFKSLLKLHSIVTRRVTDCLNSICLNPATVVPLEPTLQLLCLLAVSASTNETSADAMTFTARLLNVGMVRVFSLNRDLCVVKLPVLFSALKDIMASEHEEAIFAAMETFKSLIHSCVDDSLIREGVNRIQTSNMEGGNSAPVTIEKLSVTVESLLDYQFSSVWDMALQVVSAMFDKLGDYSSYFMRGTLKNLSDMQKLPNEDFPYRKQLHECVGSALSAMGPETFLRILPLNLEADDLAEVNVWLFPILKQYTVGAQLSFFTEIIVGMAGSMRKKCEKLEAIGRVNASKSADSLAYSLWSLLPSFCNYPLDTAQSFKDLEKVLCRVLQEQPDIRGIICTSLHTLVQQNMAIVEGKSLLSADDVSPATQRAISLYTPQLAADNLKALGCHGRDFLSILSGIFVESGKDDGGCLQSAIGDFASIAEKKIVTRLLTKTLQRLWEVTKDTGGEDMKSNDTMHVDESSDKSSPSLLRGRLLDLAVSLLPGLDAKEVDVLFSAIKPALQDNEGLIQKKAYRALSIILKNSEGFLASNLEELLKLMISVLPSCHFSAKRHRLDCLYFLIAHVSTIDGPEQEKRETICSFLTEVVLALKEVNKKTRNRAYEVLVQIGHAFGDEENGGNIGNLYQFFFMVAGGMAGDSPHMISAAVKGLARLAYEFSDLVSAAYNLLPSTFLLLLRKNREINKANLGLLKVLIAKSTADGLQEHMKSMVEGLLKWQDVTKTHFKAKVKLLLEMLVRKCGLDAVKSVMPEEHMKLLTNIRKVKERNERKLAAGSDDGRSQLSKATTSRHSRWNHSKIFSDFGDEDDANSEYMDTKSVLNRRSKASSLLKSKAASLRSKRNRDKSLPEDLDQMEDEPLDLLDRFKTRSALRSSGKLKRKSDSDDEPEFDPEGKLIIHEETKTRKKSASEADSDTKTDTGSRANSLNSSRKNLKRRKTSEESGYAYTGSEYASKKADGDLNRKDKLEPYAYWPLDRKMMSRRPEQRATARRGMSSVVRMTKSLEGKSVSAALSTKLSKFKRAQKKGSKKHK